MSIKRSLEEMMTPKNETEVAMDVDKVVSIGSMARGSLLTLMSRPSAFPNETGAMPIGEFEPIPKPGPNVTTSDTPDTILTTSKVLVVGAGGLGCEILKDLAMSGITNVHVIDLDTIDVTNLNRQFLFRQKDVGSSKAVVAAQFINERCPWMKVTAHHGMIQDKDPSFYASFNVILSGLDNVEARRWLNATVCGLVEVDEDGDPDPSTIIPIIDGGTEGFSGQSRVILPRITSCFECSLDAFPPQRNFPLCTIAETPRRPEHCIAYASILEWPKAFPDKKMDKDSPDDMKWVYETALERANTYNIAGVTYMLTMGVVKNIIPAVASTNAIVSAACVSEAVKILTFMSQSLNTYHMYMGSQGVYAHTFVYERREDCPVCTSTTRKLVLGKDTTLNELVQQLCEGDLRLKAPSLTTTSKTLYMQKPPSLEKATRSNLDLPVSSLVAPNEEITVTDPLLESVNMALSISFEMSFLVRRSIASKSGNSRQLRNKLIQWNHLSTLTDEKSKLPGSEDLDSLDDNSRSTTGNDSPASSGYNGKSNLLSMEEFFADLEAKRQGKPNRRRNRKARLADGSSSSSFLSGDSPLKVPTEQIKKVEVSSFFDQVNELVQKSKQEQLRPKGPVETPVFAREEKEETQNQTDTSPGLIPEERAKPSIGSFFDQVNELVRKNKENAAASANQESVSTPTDQVTHSSSILSMISSSESKSENAFEEDAFDQYSEIMQRAVKPWKKGVSLFDKLEQDEIDAVMNWLLADAPTIDNSIPTLDKIAEHGMAEFAVGKAKQSLCSDLEQQQRRFLEHHGWSQNQHKAAKDVLYRIGHMSAKEATGGPVDIAWQKLKEAGVQIDRDGAQNYLYVSSTFGVSARPLMSARGGSVLDFLNEGLEGVSRDSTAENESEVESANKSKVDTASEVALFHDILYEPSEQSTSIRVRVLVANGKAREAETLLDENATDELRLRTYDPVFQCYIDQGDVSAALKLYVKMKQGDKVLMKPETYVQLMSCVAENGYFQNGSPDIEGAAELGYSPASGPALFDCLANELAEDAIEISSASAKRLYNAMAQGFQAASLKRLHLLESLGADNSQADSSDLVASRVQLDPSTGLCPRTGVQLRLINLDADQKQKLRMGLLSLSESAYEQRSGNRSNLAEEELKRFGNWLANRPGKPFTAILDGPNIAYYFQNFEQGTFNFHQIKLVLDALERMGENVLVVLPKKYTNPSFMLMKASGPVRQHVTKTEREFVEGLIASGKAYVVPPSLLDDYFWMYASVCSQGDKMSEEDQYIQPGNSEGRWAGIRPMLISNDKLRDHKLALLEPRLFRRWYSNFIINFTFSAFVGDKCVDNEIGFNTADFYSREIQGNDTVDATGTKTGTAWHFPVSDWEENESFCIRIPTHQAENEQRESNE